jgi:hypothetical protein
MYYYNTTLLTNSGHEFETNSFAKELIIGKVHRGLESLPDDCNRFHSPMFQADNNINRICTRGKTKETLEQR